MLNELAGSNDVLKFLKTIPFSLEKKKYFLDLHKFSLSLNENLVTNYFSFYHDYNNIVFSGGCIRDALLLDLSSIKDLDLTFHLSPPSIKSNNLLRNDLLFNESLLHSLDELGLESFTNSIKSLSFEEKFKHFISPKDDSEIFETISKFYNQKFISFDIALRKHFATQILKQQFDCNFTYNTRKLNSSEIVNDTYGTLIQDELMGIIKSKIKLTHQEYPCDFLLVKDSLYVNKCFDFHICQAKFPHSPLSLFSTVSNSQKFTEYFLSPEYKMKAKELYNREKEYLQFIEENIDDDELFLHYLSKYLSLTFGFILNAERKVFTFNNYNKFEIQNSFKSHYKRVFAKYPYPLVLYKEQEELVSIFEIIEQDKFEVLLW